MKKLLDKSFVFMLIIMASGATFLGMVLGPFGQTDISIGLSIASCIFAAVIIIFGLSSWKIKRK